MPRKPLKREGTNVLSRSSTTTDEHHRANIDRPPISSGDTIVDSDSTVGDEQAIEGSLPNHFKHSAGAKVTKGQKEICSHGQVIDPNGGIQVLGRGVKELVQAVQALRHLGVEELDLPLPKIVVVGDQSTGKSSLIEGMSEIKVPRNAGTCTRCPLEINLSESVTDTWSCEVFLVKKYIYEGALGSSRTPGKSAIKSEGATRHRPLGPWTPQDVEDFHFATITAKSEVEGVLHLAQLATLNPSSPYEKFLPTNLTNQTTNHHQQVKFSPNVIRLDISGPSLPNLSFYDLPGVINVSDVEGEEYLISLVTNLVKEYVKAEDSINLLAIPMTDDPANSSALRLIRDLKAESRTVGCLTKPDRRQEGESIAEWVQMLNGERFRLGFGYFVIKNNPDPTVEHSIARVEESNYFENNEPWASLLDSHSDRFGTLLLQAALSLRLTAQIRKSLPRITAQVQEKAESIDAKLRELPEPLHGNLPAIVLGELMKFEKELQKHLDGGTKDYTFPKQWNDLALKFRTDLEDSRPVLLLPNPHRNRQELRESPLHSMQGTPTPRSGAHRTTAPIMIDSDDDDRSNDMDAQRSGSKRPCPSAQCTPIKLQRVNGTGPAFNGASRRYQSKSFTLIEVRSIIQDAYIGGIPAQSHPRAIEEMIQSSMAHWDKPLEAFLNSTRVLLETMVFDQVSVVFGHRQGTRYLDSIIELCGSFFKEAFEQYRQIALRVLAWELSKPRTFNEEAMSIARDKALKMLQLVRRESRANEVIDDQEMKSGKATTGAARAEKITRISDTQLKPEVYGLEIHAISTVKGYYECSYSRFVDIVCSSIHCELFGKCRNNLYPAMMEKFGVTEPGANERLAVLLAANARDEERRVVLTKEKDTIERAQDRLKGLA